MTAEPRLGVQCAASGVGRAGLLGQADREAVDEL
jgi:hypothetical protein